MEKRCTNSVKLGQAAKPVLRTGLSADGGERVGAEWARVLLIRYGALLTSRHTEEDLRVHPRSLKSTVELDEIVCTSQVKLMVFVQSYKFIANDTAYAGG